MTKIKNTKKGMAKKTLSVSLAVAMLATSNVPVWAAEFSDGADAAFTAEVEAPVVEDNTADVPEAQAMGDAWTVKLTDMPTEVEWEDTKTVTVEIKDVDGNVTTSSGLKYVWKDASTGLAVNKPDFIGTTVNTPATTSANVGKSYVLYIYDEAGDYVYTSTPFTVGKKDVAKLAYSIAVTDRYYTGLETLKNAKITGDGKVEFDIDYTGDLVNVGTVHVTATPIDTKLYKGILEEKTFEIKPVNLADYVKNITATMSTKSFEYTGKAIDVKKSDVTVVDKNTGVEISALIADDAAVTTTATNVEDKAKANITLKATESTKNYTGSATINTTDNVVVTARDLSTVRVEIASKPKKDSGAYTATDFAKTDVTFKDAAGNTLDLFNAVELVVPENTSNFGTYTITVKAKEKPTTAAEKSVKGQTTASFSIFSKSIAGATFEKATTVDGEAYVDAEEYTGSQIKKDVSKLGKVTLDGKEVDPADYTIEYGENVKAGTGYIYIIGKRTYEGSKAVVKFNINQATVSEVTAVDYVVVNKDAKSAADYADKLNLVVKAKNGATPAKEFTLKEGTDYTVTYAYDANGNTPEDGHVVATITLAENGNFKDATSSKLTKEVRIAKAIISDSDIKLVKTSYEYTGAVIVPEFDVVVGGKTLVKDKDYKITSVTNSAKAGTATLTIVGAGDYDNQVSAKANFTVTPVSAEKVEVKVNKNCTYDGTQQKPEAKDIEVTLNGNHVESQFDISSYGANVNAGKEAGTFVLTPKKDNQNFTAGTSKTVAFDIAQKPLTGSIKVYNERGIEITDSLPEFEYDGIEKTFAKVIFDTTDKNVTADDYEIKYVNNVTGGGDNGASIIVIAKGNYTANGTINDNSTGTPVKIENVLTSATKNFKINSKLYFTEKEVTVTDAEYAEGMTVKPVIVVKDGAKTLVEGVDYEVKLTDDRDSEVKGAAAVGFTGKWTVTGKGLYAATEDSIAKVTKNKATGTWKVVKKNVANLDIKAELDADGNAVVTAMNGNIKVDNKNFDVTLSEDKKTATVSATTGNKNYIGSTEVDIAQKFPVGKAMIEDVVVTGNTVAVKLAGEVENFVGDGDVGYDYVISKSSDCLNRVDRVLVNKTLPTTDTTFYYLEPGTYYAYCHAWTRDEDGMKAFGEWSNVVEFKVTAVTPEKPQITSVKISGSTVTVTYTECEGAEGYDIVLGSTLGKDAAGYKRPYDYGKLVKKNVKAGTTTVTFKDVPAGTYYVGLHAWSKEDGKKVFSKWSNIVTRTVK